MPKLCVVLNSVYNLSDKASSASDEDKKIEFEHFMEETRLDAETIRETFTEEAGFLIVEINIDTHIKAEARIKQLVESSLRPYLSDADECVVVINSHGSTANKDMQDLAVRSVVEQVSKSNIPVKHISALICHAMAKETASAAEERMRALGTLTHAIADKSAPLRIKKFTTMQILTEKLNKLTIRIAQHFPIYGPDRAYLPAEKSFVRGILEGDLGQAGIDYLAVDIAPAKTLGIKDIREAIHFVEMYMSDKATNAADRVLKKKFQEMTNLLGQVLTDMGHGLEDCLQKKDAMDIPVELRPLYEATSVYEDLRLWKDQFNTWKNQHKFSNPDGERLRIIKDYINRIAAVVSPSAGIGFFSARSPVEEGSAPSSTPGKTG